MTKTPQIAPLTGMSPLGLTDDTRAVAALDAARQKEGG